MDFKAIPDTTHNGNKMDGIGSGSGGCYFWQVSLGDEMENKMLGNPITRQKSFPREKKIKSFK